MACVRSRKRAGGTFWFLVDRHGRERSFGKGKEGEKAARRGQGRLEQAEWAEKRGEPVDLILGAAWSLRELRDRDLATTSGKASWPSRRRRWDALLSAFGEATTLDRLTPAVIQAFIATRGKAVSAQTIRNDLSLLSAALKFARRMRHASGFAGNPLAEVDRPTGTAGKDIRAETADSVQKIIRSAWKKAAEAPPHLADLWRDNAAIVELCYETSSRISQILTLRRDQVRDGMLHFPPHKLGSPRAFPVTGRIAAVLRKLPDRGIYLFPARRGATKKPYRDNLKAFWRAIAPPGFTLHGLRHSSLTAAVYAGESLPDAANRAGHKSLAMMQRVYGHIFRTPIRELPRAVDKTAGKSGRFRRSNAVEYPKKTSQTKAKTPRNRLAGRVG